MSQSCFVRERTLDKALPVSKQCIYLEVFILFALPLLINWRVLQPQLN